MLDKMILSDKECEHLTKSIAGGVGLGLALGAIINNPQLFFALGGVVGIIFSLIHMLVSRSREHKLSSETTN